MKGMLVVTASAIALAACSVVAHAADKTPEQIKAAKEFIIEGIGFSATPQTIRTKWPNAERVAKESNSKIGVEVLFVSETQNTDAMQFTFLDGKLMKIQALYQPARVKKMGGWETIAEKLVAKLGKADADSEVIDDDPKSEKIADFDWVIPEAERWFSYVVSKKSALLTICDIELARKKEAKEKAAADTGF
jgi:hypothetical protein